MARIVHQGAALLVPGSLRSCRAAPGVSADIVCADFTSQEQLLALAWPVRMCAFLAY